MPKSGPQLASLKELIEKQFQKLRPETSDDLERIRAKWVALLGTSIAENAKPLYLRDDVLHIGVCGSAWHCELKLLEEDILRRVNAGCGLGVEVKGIRFVVGA